MNLILDGILIMVLVILDQGSKFLISSNIQFQETIPMIPKFFNIICVYNTGAAFSMLNNHNAFLTAFSLVIFILLILLRRNFSNLLMHWGWLLLLAGIIGNVTDRVLHFHVIDFIDLHFGSSHWPAFNLADSYIFIAVVLFLIVNFQKIKNDGK